MSDSLTLVVGSTNKVKVQAIQSVFSNFKIVSYDANSHVSNQPTTDEETLQGAINRAKEARKQGSIGIGLEGGVCFMPQGLMLINYGALVDKDNNLYIAGGARIFLPKAIQIGIEQGLELGDVMDAYTKREGIREQEGAIGVFTANQVKRQTIFEHIGQLLYGQWQAKNLSQEGEQND